MSWFVCPRGSSFKRMLRSAICLRKVYISQKFAKGQHIWRVCWRSSIDLCLLIFQSVQHRCNTLSKILLWTKPSYFSAQFVNVWKMCATPGACVNEGGLFSSVEAVVPQSKSTELCSSAAVVPYKNLPSWVVARRPLCHKVNLQSCVARRLLCHTK